MNDRQNQEAILYMKFKHKKLLISGTAVAAAGVLGAGALLQSVLSVQASSEMMPGIETIVYWNWLIPVMMRRSVITYRGRNQV